MRVLILGGTMEASAIARALAGDGRFDPVLSLAGRTKTPVLPPIRSRVGGFGGVAGLAEYVRRERIDAIVDATHPFAVRMKANAAAIDVARVVVLRPRWVSGPGDHWLEVPSMAEAARALGEQPRRVFLTVGQQELAPFGPPHHYVIRSVDPPAHPPAEATIITARGPFGVVEETALLTGHGIEVLVTKNSGGSATVAKLAAARALGVPVVMVARPPAPVGPCVPDAQAALVWLRHTLDRGV